MAKKETRTPLKKGASQFTIVGRAHITDKTFALDIESSKTDWIYSQMQLGVNTGNGIIFSKLMGGYGATRDNVIKVHGKKKNDKGNIISDYDNRFEIDWDDRKNENILESVAEDCFIKVGIEKDNKGKTYIKKFLSAYDAIPYIAEHLSDKTVINVKGNLQYQYYNGAVTCNKNITSIFLSTKEENEFKSEFQQTILVDSDSIGKLDKDKNTFPIDAYVVDYVGKLDGKKIGENVSFVKTMYFDVVNLEFPEKTKTVLNKHFKPSKSNGIIEVGVVGEFLEGGSVSTATLEDLDDDVREMVEDGIMSQEEAFAKYTNGSKDRRMVIKKFITKNVGTDETKKIVIVKDEDKYTVEDLVFIDQFIASEEDETEEDTSVETTTDTIVSDDDEDDDEAWLKELEV